MVVGLGGGRVVEKRCPRAHQRGEGRAVVHE
eukprot:COSAG06_NODE_49524_length_325_cov_0.300885_1_plen_30_part_10